MKNRFLHALFGASMAAVLVISSGCATKSTPSQSVRLLEPVNNAVVGTSFKVRFGVVGMVVEPAGDVIANSGHNHLLIDMDSIASGESIPFTPKHMHFGKGQQEADIKLEPGTYKITAQFANGAHQSYGKEMSQTITITITVK